jgi:ribonuclease HI
MSFILKTLEKLIDRRIRDIDLKDNPLDKSQHAYQPGKGTESALHCLITEIEKNVQNKGTSITVFIDIEGAFDNTMFKVIEDAARTKGISTWVINWISAMLRNRNVKSKMEGSSIRYNPTRGCPQGGCLSPLLWCLVVDSLIMKLKEKGFKVTAYADDLAITISGGTKFKNALCDKMNEAMRIIEDWCRITKLNVNPEKSNLMRFTKGKPRSSLKRITLHGKEIKQVDNTKYLGLHMDATLSWNSHIEKVINKGRRALWASKAMISRNWGLNPRQALWLYQQIILPRITYGSIVWWQKAQTATNAKKLQSFQRQALMIVTGAMRTTPSAALEALLNVSPLDIKIKTSAIAGCYRLKKAGTWRNDSCVTPHRAIENVLNSLTADGADDSCRRKWKFKKSYTTIINERNNWSYSLNIINNPYCWFSDGSKKDNRAAYGIHNPFAGISKSFRISDHATIMQAELKGIEECACECLDMELSGKTITILTDSQAALKALRKASIDSHTVWNCASKLDSLAANNQVKIAWIPGHRGLEGNEKADELANLGIDKTSVDAVVPVAGTLLQNKITNWERKEVMKTWSINKQNLRHSNVFIKGFEERKSKFLLNSSRKSIRVLVGILTGHGCLNKFLKIIGKTQDDKCRFCKVDGIKEDMMHLLKDCDMLHMKRHQILGDGAPSDQFLANLDYKVLMEFAIKSKIYGTFFKED